MLVDAAAAAAAGVVAGGECGDDRFQATPTLCHPPVLLGPGVALMTIVSYNTTTVFGEPGELILS